MKEYREKEKIRDKRKTLFVLRDFVPDRKLHLNRDANYICTHYALLYRVRFLYYLREMGERGIMIMIIMTIAIIVEMILISHRNNSDCNSNSSGYNSNRVLE